MSIWFWGAIGTLCILSFLLLLRSLRLEYICDKYREANINLQTQIDENIQALDEASQILKDPKVQDAINQIR